jgi:ATP-dependent protease ClpP protease subunit
MLFAAVPAQADILLLMDGRQLRGEIVEETSSHVVFRHFVAGFWTNAKFTRRQIDSVHEEQGDQSDLGAAGSESSPNHSQPNTPDTSHLPKVVVIPLHGTVGSAGEDAIRNTFDAQVLAQCFAEAQKLEPHAVILDIQSPGGLVSEMEAICETILAHNRSLRIVAYPREAFSAAAIISLCCREMIVHPNARIGAAVIITAGPGGVSAVDAKMASPHHARQKQFMKRSGRPYEVVAAMTIQESELWWSSAGGFANVPPPKDAESEWALLDGKSTVLTMTADDAVQWKLAAGKAISMPDILVRLGITGEVSVVDMQSEVDRYNAVMQRRFDDLIRQVRVYFGSLRELRDGIVDLGDAYNNKDRDAAKKYKSIISQQVTRIQTSGRAIAKIDKGLLARRIKVPDVALDQMKEDAALLGRISSLLKTDTYDGFKESVERLNTVLKAWQALLD